MSWALEKGGNRCPSARQDEGQRAPRMLTSPSAIHPAAGAGGSAGGTFATGWQKFFLFAGPRFSRVPKEPLAIVRAA
jgi:hypothetical protein